MCKKLFLILSFVLSTFFISCNKEKTFVNFSEKDYTQEWLNGTWNLVVEVTENGVTNSEEDFITIDVSKNSVNSKISQSQQTVTEFFAYSENSVNQVLELAKSLGGSTEGDTNFLVSSDRKVIKMEFKIVSPKNEEISKDDSFMNFSFKLMKQ